MPPAARVLWSDMLWLCRSDPGWLEFGSGVWILFWGLLLAMPFNTFEVSTTYLFMARIASEETWGAIFVAIGSVQVVAVIARRSAPMWLAALASASLWAIMANMFWISNPWAFSPLWTTSMCALMSYCAWYRIRNG